MNQDIPDGIFPRSFQDCYPIAVRGEGIYLFDEQGRKYLDASGGAAVVTIGHGVPEIVDAISRQARQLAYAHTSHFHTRVAIELAEHLQAKFPGPAQCARVHFTSGGSEATETAIKVVRQYWLSQNQPQRYKIISRWHSYHGATLGALTLSGNQHRRKAYELLLPQVEHVSACFCYRCPFGSEFPSCDLACARQLEQAILNAGQERVAGFILEPIVGASSGAVPPEGYLRVVREICDAYNILLIADEVMVGAGRTGRYFAVEHWNVIPDIILLGKGLASGYAPLGATLVTERVWQAIARGTGSLDHGFTYQGHPPSLAAGLAVQRYLDQHDLIRQVRERGDYLAQRLERLRDLSCVGDIRGKGLLWVIELVADQATRAPYPPQVRLGKLLFEELRARGVMVYPGRGTADGLKGDHILIAPPFVIEEKQIDFLVDQIEAALVQINPSHCAPTKSTEAR